jgi:TM2 domain-containing membrane protein YozV
MPGAPGMPMVPMPPGAYRYPQYSTRNKVAAGLLGIFLGGLGVHRFYLGYIGIGIVQMLVTICTIPCMGVGAIWGFVEGILCFTGHIRDVDGLPLRD